MRPSVYIPLAALWLAAVPAAAQQRERSIVITRNGDAPFVWSSDDEPDSTRAWLGIQTGESGRRDTLGLLVRDVVEGSPAAKGGVEEGMRLTSINGVSLKLSKDDADDAAMRGVLQRRLTRVVRDLKPGASVELGVYAEGRTRSIRLTAASAADAPDTRGEWGMSRREFENRAVLGVSLGSEPSKRDTLGIFVQGVTSDGPAEKAGLVEGVRIAAINGQDLRVAREDAGDPSVAQAKVTRLQRVLRGLKAGDDVELRVVEAGRSRTVKVKTAKASELSSAFDQPVIESMRIPLPRVPMPPMPPSFDGETIRSELSRGLRALPRRIEINRGRVSI
ncbi:MAG: PDZ domain-containing protein [Gemmatimonadaceae bacterium]|nr:PDZ domain-containing protein [Gemmatimonadaceae bacterium]